MAARGAVMLGGAWRWLISRPVPPMRPLQVIAWWEMRRIPYNLVVGAAGVVSLLLLFFFIFHSGELKPGEDAIEPMALLAAPFVVNFCYTAGWVCELLLMARRKHRAWVGPVLFVLGTAFSLVVIAVPSVCWGAIWLFRTIRGMW